ncbi:MAG: putative porin [Flavobacteriaceae bacterium]
MRILFTLLFLCFSLAGLSQEAEKDKPRKSLLKTKEQKEKELARKAPITSYKIYNLQRDTTFVDTSLTIQKEYQYNYLRKDLFGRIAFLNEGQTYNTLDYGLNKVTAFPEFGHRGKHLNYIEANDIKYYSVATPLTDLYFKTVMEQGQSLDAFLTVNTSEKFNFSIAYKGLRSLGKYINQLSSNGNFRCTASYKTPQGQYVFNAHYTGQDLLNGENGGITTPADFESKDANFKQRQRLEVFLTDATSFMKGKRFFVDHRFRIASSKDDHNLFLTHQINYETKFFEYYQPTVASQVGTQTINHFGDSYVNSYINDQVHYNRLYNQIGLSYESKKLGRIQFYTDDFRYNYFYNTAVVLNNQSIPSLLSDKINSLGARYDYQQNHWSGFARYTNSLTNQSLTDIELQAAYKLNEKNKISFSYQSVSKLPDAVYNLHQSSYIAYNWFNNFKNQKSNTLTAKAETQFGTAELQISNYDNFLYFSDDSSNALQQLISPKQYEKAIQYLSVKASKEFRFWRIGLDNTLLYQQTKQDDDVLNVPKFVTRNTLYYSDYYFSRALYLQTGFIFNYFTKYYANGYNPILTDFYVQNQTKIGDFPLVDFFINARVRQTRIFLKAEHFNSSMASQNRFYSAPGYPYRDFIIRFGLVWNFFQ